MLRNVASQKYRVFAWNATTGLAKTGDAANISAHIRIDDGASAGTNDAAPTEASSTNEPGYYDFDLTQAETNGAKVSLAPKSSTADIQVVACPPVVYTRPQYSSLLGIESDGDLTKVNTLDGHTPQTGDSFARIGANGASLTSLATAAELAKVPKSDGSETWNSTALASIRQEVESEITDNGLDHLFKNAVVGADVTDNTVIARLVSKSATADWDSFVHTTDSLQAIRDNMGIAQSGDAFAELASGTYGLSALKTILDTKSSQTSVDDVPTNAELATAIITGLTTALTEGYRGTGATGSVRDLLYEMLAHLGEFANSGTTKTTKKLDGSTTAKTYTYDDADAPTSITEAT